MSSNGKRKTSNSFTKAFWKRVYYTIPSIIICLVFWAVFNSTHSFWISIESALIVFLMMDMICSMIESIIEDIVKSVVSIKTKKKKVRDTKYFEDYGLDIGNMDNLNSTLKKWIVKSNKAPQLVVIRIEEICSNMKALLSLARKEKKGSYQIRYLFKVLFPEFVKVTQEYLNALKDGTVEQEDVEEYLFLLSMMDKYIAYLKSKIDSEDSASLGHSISVLTVAIQFEMEKSKMKGETDK